MDPKARKISIGFPGGSLTATRGLLEALFGTNLVNSSQYGEETVSVQGHSRTRVIGGASTPVAAHRPARWRIRRRIGPVFGWW
jgi:hypothetical protein